MSERAQAVLSAICTSRSVRTIVATALPITLDCDKCKKAFAVNKRSYCCTECDYDCCLDCVRKLTQRRTNDRHVRGHVWMMMMRYGCEKVCVSCASRDAPEVT